MKRTLLLAQAFACSLIAATGGAAAHDAQPRRAQRRRHRAGPQGRGCRL
jgi:hypothetical protein